MCDFAIWSGKVNKDDVEYLGLECGIRNHDATGLAFLIPSNKYSTNKTVKALKAPVEADDFYISDAWDSLWDNNGQLVTAGMAHSRIATNGSPQDNINNHPHISENGSVLVHKGVVQSIVHMESAVSSCDSEQILRSLDEYGLDDGLSNLSGWAHIAYMPYYEPDTMYLYSNSSKLQYHELEDNLKVVNTNKIDFQLSDREIIKTTELDLNTWYALDIKNYESNTELIVWKKGIKLNDMHSRYYGKSEKVFRSKLNANL